MIILYKGDYNTALRFYARVGEQHVPLHMAKVFFEFNSKEKGHRVGGGEAKVIDIMTGLISYTFKDNELESLGAFQGKLTIDLSQGAVRESLTFDFEIKDPHEKDELKALPQKKTA